MDETAVEQTPLEKYFADNGRSVDDVVRVRDLLDYDKSEHAAHHRAKASKASTSSASSTASDPAAPAATTAAATKSKRKR